MLSLADSNANHRHQVLADRALALLEPEPEPEPADDGGAALSRQGSSESSSGGLLGRLSRKLQRQSSEKSTFGEPALLAGDIPEGEQSEKC